MHALLKLHMVSGERNDARYIEVHGKSMHGKSNLNCIRNQIKIEGGLYSQARRRTLPCRWVLHQAADPPRSGPRCCGSGAERADAATRAGTSVGGAC